MCYRAIVCLQHFKWSAPSLLPFPCRTAGVIRRPIVLLPLLPEVPDFHLVYRKEDESTATIRSIRAWLKEIIAALELQPAAGEP